MRGVQLKKDLAYYMHLDYYRAIVNHQESGQYQVIYPQLPGCMGWAKSYEDIEVVSETLRRQWFDAALSDGFVIPEPKK